MRPGLAAATRAIGWVCVLSTENTGSVCNGVTDREFCRTIRCCHGRPHALRHRRTRYFWEALSNNDHRLDKEKMLHKFLLIGASALALVSSALAALPAVADDNDFFYLTQPNGKKIVLPRFRLLPFGGRHKASAKVRLRL
jgi:hypothetical protein